MAMNEQRSERETQSTSVGKRLETFPFSYLMRLCTRLIGELGLVSQSLLPSDSKAFLVCPSYRLVSIPTV
jgi:hypothetical protein